MAAAPYFLAGHPALDFANTLAAPTGSPVDFIPDGRALLAWLVAAGLVSKAAAADAARRFPAAALDEVAGRARTLRDRLRAALPLPAPQAVPRPLIDAVNRILSTGGGCSRLELRDGRLGLVSSFKIEQPDHLLLAVAEAVADLLAHVDAAAIKPCANHTCILWFVDKTRGARRLYCSAAICGNRHKVAAFRARRKADARH